MSTKAFYQHPLYQVAARHFQQGEWQDGLGKVEQLIKLYPLEQELRSLRNELMFKQRLDSAEISEQAIQGRERVRRLLVRGVAAAAVVLIVTLALRTYSGWIGEQFFAANERVQHEIRNASLVARQVEVESLMRVGRLQEAEAVLNEMAALNPDFAGLPKLRGQLAQERELADLYQLSLEQIEAGDWVNAMASLQQLSALDPNYRDVRIQITYVERQTLLGNLLSEGEAAMARGAWPEAIRVFESARTLHPDHQTQYVEARLFESYVNAGRAVLVGQEDSLEALEQAETYLREALALRPQNVDIKRERELAGLFLQAQEAFDAGSWTAVIEALELVIDAEPEYAQGTARQTLYDGYIARGEQRLDDQMYDAALGDFERAVSLAEEDEAAALRLYEGELQLAEAYGAAGNFEAAVVHYRSAAAWGRLLTRSAENSALLSTLQEAEAYAALGNFGVAYERYASAVRLANANQTYRVHVVASGEYLSLIASRYGSTVRAIVQANNIENQNLIFPGQQLQIPVLP